MSSIPGLSQKSFARSRGRSGDISGRTSFVFGAPLQRKNNYFLLAVGIAVVFVYLKFNFKRRG